MNTSLDAQLSQKRVLIADGAAGTMLQQMGLPPGNAPDAWNLTHPDEVKSLHRQYCEVGAEVIYTNTFGGTRIRLRRAGLDDEVRRINLAGVQLARSVAEEFANRLVFGDIGPTGELLAPVGTLPYEVAMNAFAEQAAALAEGGVDALIIETLSDLEEARAAVEGVRSVTDLPVAVTLSFDSKGRTMFGVTPEQAIKALLALGVTIAGANCGRTLSETLEAVLKMRAVAPEALLMAKPNAGLPHTKNSALVYEVTPETMADTAVRFVTEAGVRIFGGCCGSTPEHIRAIATALARLC
ncbi:MAG: homocysteine S-methyltransferase family protein [Anaerolineae bacterium]|nr:homocysteine S-methyltransferase family protein [Anaerolineae bacterium]